MTLSPSTRSLAEPPTLGLPPGTQDVRLTLRLEPDEYSTYDVAIRDLASNVVVWRGTNISAQRMTEGKVLAATIPASTFRTGRYLVNATAGPRAEIVGSYPVKVVVQ
jgi:hypothetical protein